jgi:hypothetical protein
LAEALVPLGEVLIDQGRAREAEPLLREALAIQEKAFGKNDPRSGEAARILGRAVAPREAALTWSRTTVRTTCT